MTTSALSVELPSLDAALGSSTPARRIAVLVGALSAFVVLHAGLELFGRLSDGVDAVSLMYAPSGLIFATIVYFGNFGAAIVFLSSVVGFFMFRDPRYPALDGMAYILFMVMNVLLWRGLFVRLGIIGAQLMQRPNWAIGLMAMAVLVSAGNTGLGMLALRHAGIVTPGQLVPAAQNYFLGELIGVLAIGPIFALLIFPVMLRSRQAKSQGSWKWLRTLVIYGALGVIGVFLIWHAKSEYRLQLIYLGSVPILIAAVRGHIRETCLAILVFATSTATGLALSGLKIDSDLSLFMVLIIAAAYIVVAAISSQRKTALSLESALAQRDQLSATQRLLADKVNHLQKMESLGTLAGGMAHELNNLLQPILTFARAAEGAEGAQRHEFLGRIRECAQAARMLVSDVLQFSRPVENQPRTAPIAQFLPDLLTNALDIASEVLPARVALHRPADVPACTLKVEPEKLTQVLMNLLRNASDAMPTGGDITLSASLPATLPDTLRSTTLLLAGQTLQLTITDTGLGMDPETRKRAIDPFFTTKAIGRGTGLGLSTVHGIINAWSGLLEITSAPGAGTTLTLWLPVHDWPAGVQANEVAGAAAAQFGGDDNGNNSGR